MKSAFLAFFSVVAFNEINLIVAYVCTLQSCALLFDGFKEGTTLIINEIDEHLFSLLKMAINLLICIRYSR